MRHRAIAATLAGENESNTGKFFQDSDYSDGNKPALCPDQASAQIAKALHDFIEIYNFIYKKSISLQTNRQVSFLRF